MMPILRKFSGSIDNFDLAMISLLVFACVSKETVMHYCSPEAGLVLIDFIYIDDIN